MKTADQLSRQITQTKQAILSIRKKIDAMRGKMVELESQLIEETLLKQKLEEELRVHQNTTIHIPLTDREREIEAFRKKYPELCKPKEEI